MHPNVMENSSVVIEKMVLKSKLHVSWTVVKTISVTRHVNFIHCPITADITQISRVRADVFG